MRTRRLGRTGLSVSELAFGGGQVGGILVYGSETTRRAALARALEAGITLFDTAPSYGDGVSEEALGRLLPELGGSPVVATKVRLDPLAPDLAGQLGRSVEGSLRRLRRDSVDILHLHNPLAAADDSHRISAERAVGEAADALDGLRERGLVRFVGVTALGETAAVRRTVSSGRFDTAQVYYNPLNPSAGMAMPAAWEGHDFAGVLAACREAGVGVFAIRIFAGGVVASEKPHGREVPVTDDSGPERERRRAAAVFDRLGEEYGTRAQMAVRFALANPDVGSAVVGMAETAHLEEALAAAEKGPLPEAALAALRALYAENFGLG